MATADIQMQVFTMKVCEKCHEKISSPSQGTIKLSRGFKLPLILICEFDI